MGSCGHREDRPQPVIEVHAEKDHRDRIGYRDLHYVKPGGDLSVDIAFVERQADRARCRVQ